MGCDVLLHGGWVLDGTSAPPFRADVAITGSMISAVGRLTGMEAAERVDVTGFALRDHQLTGAGPGRAVRRSERITP